MSLPLPLSPKCQAPSSIKAWFNYYPLCWFTQAEPLTSIPTSPVSVMNPILAVVDCGVSLHPFLRIPRAQPSAWYTAGARQCSLDGWTDGWMDGHHDAEWQELKTQ